MSDVSQQLDEFVNGAAVADAYYLFAGSEAGAKRAAIIYSLVASCKWHGHDPFAYFSDVLKKVTTWPANKIDDLLPVNWTPLAKLPALKLTCCPIRSPDKRRSLTNPPPCRQF